MGLVALAGCASTAGGGRQLVLSDDGLSELEAPRSWETRPNFSAKADIRLADSMGDNYLLVNTYLPEDTREMPLEEFGSRLSDALLKNMAQGRMSAPRPLKIGERPAIEYELRSQDGDTAIVYLSTVVEGASARYHLIAWTVADGDLAGLRQVMGSFRESAARRAGVERVQLVFDWPQRLKSQASFQLKSSKRGEQYEMRGESQMSLRPAGQDELLVSTRVTRHQLSGALGGGQDKEKEAYLQSVVKATLTELPDYVVNTDGEFVRVQNLSAYHRRVQDALLKGLPAGKPEAHAKARQMVQSMLTEERLAVSLQDEWGNLVGNWAGGSYAPGQTYRFTVPYQAPALEQRSFPMQMTQQLVGHVPCHAGAKGQACVRLLQTTRVAGPEYTQAMSDYVRKTAGGDVRVTEMEVLATVELVADPETLLPYTTSKKETKRVTVSAGGRSSSSEDVKETSASYRY
jgi:hypothetical protein